MQKIRHKISRFLALRASERQIFLRTMILLPIVSVCLEITSIKGTLAWLRHQSSFRENIPEREQDLAMAHRTARLVRQAIHYNPIKGKCLSQSIVLWHLLNLQGIKSEVCIGVQKEDGKLPLTIENFNAHAWVEYRGEVLNDLPDVRQRFSTFERVLMPPES